LADRCGLSAVSTIACAWPLTEPCQAVVGLCVRVGCRPDAVFMSLLFLLKSLIFRLRA
jgi:hypothetical protein